LFAAYYAVMPTVQQEIESAIRDAQAKVGK
jgi:hypothetical protein